MKVKVKSPFSFGSPIAYSKPSLTSPRTLLLLGVFLWFSTRMSNIEKADITYIMETKKNTPAVSTIKINNPASAGPATLVKFILELFREIAFIRL